MTLRANTSRIVAAHAPRRLLIVSNRLPITARADHEGRVRLAHASGGLATGLQSWRDRSRSLWIGWAGDTSGFSDGQRAIVDARLRARGIVAVHLTSAQIQGHYSGFSNRVIWPLFHYLVDRVPVEVAGWDSYREVNELFADAVVRAYRPGDAIWIHDYQLMLVPALVRSQLPGARIGFFLHIPFPSSEVFRVLPWRRQILEGLLGANVIGFHTFAYLRHFVTSLLHVEGLESEVDCVRVGDRIVQLGVFPMSVDAAHFEQLAHDPEVLALAAAIRQQAGGRQIVLGVDRLDYTKGILRRLEAFDRLFAAEPLLRDSVRYMQIAVPSRGKVDSYQKFRRRVEGAVGRINGSAATFRSTPIHYVHRSVTRRELVALYCAADVMLVTPLRDGMNLVAKEFVASRTDEDGVLVLSEFAGAAAELGEASIVNPFDVDAMALTIRKALAMDRSERRTRMRGLRRRVREYDVHLWADRFITRLGRVDMPSAVPDDRASPAHVHRLFTDLRRSPHLSLLLDYDGTLVPIAQTPELAVPDPQLMALLEALAARPGTELHIVSGRPRDVLHEWFGRLPISLWAEHGFWHRSADHRPWAAAAMVPLDWMKKVYPILEQFTANTPGSLIEQKSAALAWHYRVADPEFGAQQAQELRMVLTNALSNQPLEVIEGKKVIEVRLRGVDKGLVARHVVSLHDAHQGAVLAIGDDRTDEDLFGALPDWTATIAVGSGSSRARYRLADHEAVRAQLGSLLDHGLKSVSASRPQLRQAQNS